MAVDGYTPCSSANCSCHLRCVSCPSGTFVAAYLVKCQQQIQCWQAASFLMFVCFFSLVHHLLHAVCSNMTSGPLKGKSLWTSWPRLFREGWALTTRSLDTSCTENTTVCFLPGKELKSHHQPLCVS